MTLVFPSPLVGEGGSEADGCPSPDAYRFAQVRHPLPQGERVKTLFKLTPAHQPYNGRCDIKKLKH